MTIHNNQGYASDLSIDAADVRLGRREYSPYLNRSYPDRVFFGDTHLHTSYSTDAGMMGNILGPDEAFRFARGETVRATGGERAKLIRPLDFVVVSEHAENLGLAKMISESNPDLLRNPFGRQLHDLVKAGKITEAFLTWGQQMTKGEDPIQDSDLTRAVWNEIMALSERFNQPGVFTTLHGFEWSPAPNGNNLHRGLIFRDGEARVMDLVPFSSYDSNDPEDLWAWMDAYQKRTGGRVFAIPHNSNLSNGLMFDDVTYSGKPLTREYAERRAYWEPLCEVTQYWGDCETHPALSPTDEFADYYRWDKGNFGLFGKKPDMLPREYVRQALQRGLAYQASLGVNPFKFGVNGGTDSHTSLPMTREENFFGKIPSDEPGAGEARYMEKMTGIFPAQDGSDTVIRHYQVPATGLTAVWSRENTRGSIWDAMARREVYATTGTRMIVRVFAGWDFQEDDIARPGFAELGYARGVPMGADLHSGPQGGAPTFMVRALRDVDGANLDRIQIIKGWLDVDGSLHEKVYDVAWAGDRTPDADGKLPPVGSTVDGAHYTNNIGEPMLLDWWQDPDFDPAENAIYYIRVLEIPTPSWLAYDKAFFGDVVDLPEDAVLVQQERAYTSPIWYTPQ